MPLRNEQGGTLLPAGVTASGYGGAAVDGRAGKNFGMLEYSAQAASAVLTFQASFDGSANGNWYPIMTVTALAAAQTAYITGGFFPWVRMQVNAIYSGAGNTGFPGARYALGLV